MSKEVITTETSSDNLIQKIVNVRDILVANRGERVIEGVFCLFSPDLKDTFIEEIQDILGDSYSEPIVFPIAVRGVVFVQTEQLQEHTIHVRASEDLITTSELYHGLI